MIWSNAHAPTTDDKATHWNSLKLKRSCSIMDTPNQVSAGRMESISVYSATITKK